MVMAATFACARPLPPRSPQAALYRDLQRLVTLQGTSGWQIDRFAIKAILPEALMSVCHVPPAQRQALLHWLDTRIGELGGPVEAAYQARGKDLDEVSELLEVTRIRKTLATALATADEDCPFWIEPSNHFAGRQISDNRWQLSAGGGGKGVLVRRAGETDLHFGGAGRLLLGRNIGSRWALYTGAEVGGNAGFPKNANGDRESLVLAVDVVAPVVARYSLINSYFELEAGYMAHLTEEDWRQINHGLHLGASIGGRTARVRWFFPGGAFGISYERFVDSGTPVHAIKMGFRVALDMDF